jgi:glycosyltransferase involved in cell wall biosynthesis
MDELKPDIIHLHNIHNHFIHVGRLFDYIKKHNIPVVWTLHDCWPFTGHCAYFDYANCDKWKTMCHDCPSIHEYPPTWFFDRTTRNYKDKKDAFSGVNNLTLVTPSKWLAELTRESFLSDYPVVTINNGIDIDVFHPTNDIVKERLGISGKKMLLAMATTFDRRKGTQYLKQLPEMLNDDEVLVLVGLAKEQLAQFNMPRCIGIGRTNSVEELAAYYSGADVFINPTLEDNFPTTNIEALACGTPVVTFKTGGSVESVLDGESIVSENEIIYSSVGAVVPKDDVQAMLTAVCKIMAKGKGAFSSACRRKAEERYDKNKQYMKYIELYNEIYAK